MRRTLATRGLLWLAALAAGVLLWAGQAAALPTGFQETTVFSGLTQPTAVRFAPDGRVFVAEKSGLIKVFDGLADTTPTIFADLRTNVHNFWDRGLLGLALAPELPDRPVRLRALHARRGDRRHGAALGHARRHVRPLPDAARARPATAASSAAASRASTALGDVMAGDRAGADRGLVPAVPEPLDRRRSRSAPTARST